MKRIAVVSGVAILLLSIAMVLPKLSSPEPISAQNGVYALVELPAGFADGALKGMVTDVFDVTGAEGRCLALVGGTEEQLNSLVSSGCTVIRQCAATAECLESLLQLRDELVPPSNIHHTLLGPDAGGYYAVDSNERGFRGAVTFNWLAPAGKKLDKAKVKGNLDDGYWYPVPIGFSFKFYGQSFTRCAIGTNGQLWFEDKYLGLGNIRIPGPAYNVQRFIAVLWDDLDPRAGQCNIYYQTFRSREIGKRAFVVTWVKIPHYSYTDSYAGNTATFQVVLYEGSNNILMQYQDVDFGDPADESWGRSATVGIQKDKNTGLLYSFNQANLKNGLAILFTPMPPAILLEK